MGVIISIKNFNVSLIAVTETERFHSTVVMFSKIITSTADKYCWKFCRHAGFQEPPLSGGSVCHNSEVHTSAKTTILLTGN
jgi:hypothetical protein